MQNNSMQGLNNLLGIFKRFFCASPRCLITYLVHGLFIIIPLVVTIWVIAWLFNFIDGMLAPILTWGFGHNVPGLGFGIVIVSVVLIGYLGIKIRHRKAFGFIEARVIKIPLLGAIYGGTRQILNSFTTTNTERFLEVVFMEFPRKGIYTVGFVTSTARNGDGGKLLNVFIPTAPNPIGGFLQIVPESEVIHTSMPVSDAMKLIISAGRVSREDIADMLIQVPKLRSEEKIR